MASRNKKQKTDDRRGDADVSKPASNGERYLKTFEVKGNQFTTQFDHIELRGSDEKTLDVAKRIRTFKYKQTWSLMEVKKSLTSLGLRDNEHYSITNITDTQAFERRGKQVTTSKTVAVVEFKTVYAYLIFCIRLIKFTTITDKMTLFCACCLRFVESCIRF